MFSTLVAVVTITTFVSSFASFRQHRVAQRANERVDTLMGSLIGSDDLHRMHQIDRRLRIATHHEEGQWVETVRAYIEKSVEEDIDPSLSADSARVCAVAFQQAQDDDLARSTVTIVAVVTLCATVAGLAGIAVADDWAPIATMVALQLLILFLLWRDVRDVSEDIERCRRDLEMVDGTSLPVGIVPATVTWSDSRRGQHDKGPSTGGNLLDRLASWAPTRRSDRTGGWWEQSRAGQILPLWAYPHWRRAYDARDAAYQRDGQDSDRELAQDLAEIAVRYAPLDPEARRLHAAIQLDGLTGKVLELDPDGSPADKELVDRLEAALRQARAANILRLREQYNETGACYDLHLKAKHGPAGAPRSRAVVGMPLRGDRPFKVEMGRAEVLLGLITKDEGVRGNNLRSGWSLLREPHDEEQLDEEQLRDRLRELVPVPGTAVDGS